MRAPRQGGRRGDRLPGRPPRASCAVAEGVVEAIPMTRESYVDWLQHLAEEKGKKFDPATVGEGPVPHPPDPRQRREDRRLSESGRSDRPGRAAEQPRDLPRAHRSAGRRPGAPPQRQGDGLRADPPPRRRRRGAGARGRRRAPRPPVPLRHRRLAPGDPRRQARSRRGAGDLRRAARPRRRPATAPGKLEPLGWIWTTPGFADEKIWLYLATGLEPTSRAWRRRGALRSSACPLPRPSRRPPAGRSTTASRRCALLRAAR